MNLLRLRQGAKVVAHGKQLQRFEGAGVFGEYLGVARANAVFGGYFLGFVRVQVVQVCSGQLAGAFLGHGAFHHSHRVFGNDADRRVHRINLAGTKLTIHRHHLRLKGNQHIANVALQEDGGGVAPALGQHRHVLEQFAHKLRRLRVGTAGFAHVAPGRQVGHAAIAAGLGVDHNHLDIGFDQIVPVLDAFGVAVAGQKQHGGGGGRGVVREFSGPVLGYQTAIGQKLHVGGGVHGDDISVEPVVDGTCLCAGTTVGLVDLDVLAGGLLVVRDKRGVEILVELARYIVGRVEQGLRGGQLGCRQGDARNGEADLLFEFHQKS